MSSIKENRYASRSRLLLSVQRALLGAIGTSVLAVYVDLHEDDIDIVVFAEDRLPEDEREELNTAESEVWADYGPTTVVNVKIIENAQQPCVCPESGDWAFIRFGCLTK